MGDAEPTGATRHIARGEQITRFAALAIARYDGDPGMYLFYCDPNWEVLTDTLHDSIDGAIAQARFEFGSVTFVETD